MSSAYSAVLLFCPAVMSVQLVLALSNGGNVAECEQYADYAVSVFETTSPDVYTVADRDDLVSACVQSGARDIPKCFWAGMNGEELEACASEYRLGWLTPDLLVRIAERWPQWEPER